MRIEKITRDHGPPPPLRLVLVGWWRIVARDGSTIAYCASAADAHLVAGALDGQHPGDDRAREHG